MNRIHNRHLIFIITLITAVLSLCLFLIAVAGGWFGEADGTADVFCEAGHDGWIKQPANTWSNFGFMIAGLLIAWQLSTGKFSHLKNTLTQSVFFATFFSCLVVLLGPGSMAMHATQTSVGGFFDMLSMYLIAAFMVAFAMQRFFKLQPLYFTLIFGVVLGSCILAHFANVRVFFFGFFGSAVFAFYITVAIIFETLNLFVRKMKHNKMWGIAGLFFLLTAFGIWNISLTGAPFCDPSSLVQGHAIWHILDAVAVYCLFRHYVSEDNRVIDFN